MIQMRSIHGTQQTHTHVSHVRCDFEWDYPIMLPPHHFQYERDKNQHTQNQSFSVHLTIQQKRKRKKSRMFIVHSIALNIFILISIRVKKKTPTFYASSVPSLYLSIFFIIFS